MESGVALPHADPTTILKSHIYIVSLKKSINWGDRTVKLIIMVNLSEEDLQEIREVVEELYQFIDEKKKVDALVKVNDSVQMLQILVLEETKMFLIKNFVCFISNLTIKHNYSKNV